VAGDLVDHDVNLDLWTHFCCREESLPQTQITDVDLTKIQYSSN
jgi:hypothetical protein